MSNKITSWDILKDCFFGGITAAFSIYLIHELHSREIMHPGSSPDHLDSFGYIWFMTQWFMSFLCIILHYAFISNRHEV